MGFFKGFFNYLNFNDKRTGADLSWGRGRVIILWTGMGVPIGHVEGGLCTRTREEAEAGA